VPLLQNAIQTKEETQWLLFYFCSGTRTLSPGVFYGVGGPGCLPSLEAPLSRGDGSKERAWGSLSEQTGDLHCLGRVCTGSHPAHTFCLSSVLASGFELRTSGWLGGHATPGATPPALFCDWFFADEGLEDTQVTRCHVLRSPR
jgi:hypothetical protein